MVLSYPPGCALRNPSGVAIPPRVLPTSDDKLAFVSASTGATFERKLAHQAYETKAYRELDIPRRRHPDSSRRSRSVYRLLDVAQRLRQDRGSGQPDQGDCLLRLRPTGRPSTRADRKAGPK